MSDAEMGAVWFVLIVTALLLTLAYDRLRHRMRACRRCTGGRIYSPFSNRWRDCPLCQGTGIRVAGRR
ncbi:hypothetical protein AB0K40_17605 [Nonomuraea bangladeshensis]|uniref:Uncharacterized protein n=1 Tax=Nonomuraea bangladeshensis TaxID=404385 RepID=A0ABV3H4R3_9ACTN